MERRVLRRHIWGYSVCLCPTNRTLGLNEFTKFISGSLISDLKTEWLGTKLEKWKQEVKRFSEMGKIDRLVFLKATSDHLL